jgi:hypothetical protein
MTFGVLSIISCLASHSRKFRIARQLRRSIRFNDRRQWVLFYFRVFAEISVAFAGNPGTAQYEWQCNFGVISPQFLNPPPSIP